MKKAILSLDEKELAQKHGEFKAAMQVPDLSKEASYSLIVPIINFIIAKKLSNMAERIKVLIILVLQLVKSRKSYQLSNLRYLFNAENVATATL